MRKGVLIMGSGPAALQAALDLADANLTVHLAENKPFLETSAAPSLCPNPAAAQQLDILKHPRITLWTGTSVESIEKKNGRYAVALKTKPRYVDPAKCTGCKECIDVCPVQTAPDGTRAVHLPDGAQPGCAAIMKEGHSPCAAACPGGVHAQGYVALAAKGRFQEAVDLIREAIPFPGIMGRICTHPCEIQCRRNDLDGPVSIRRLKRFLADWDETYGSGAAPRPCPEPPEKDAKRVAVVGAGPAGMTAAATLAGWGYRVTVFDKLPVRGGMLAVGIPAYRLPRDVIDREYAHIEAMGVEIRLNTAIGPDGDLTVDDLLNNGFDAVCLAVGAHKSLYLNIPGESLPGVVHGIELLKAASLSHQPDAPDTLPHIRRWLRRGKATRVIVMGGGNTAMDVARTVKRLGAEDIRILYRRTREEMPALPEEIHEAKAEGIAIDFLTAPVAVLGDETHGVSGIRCIQMKLAEPDESGRRRPVPIADSEFDLPADLVIPAIGQAADVEGIGASAGIQATRHQRIAVDPDTLATGRSGVFAAGDAVTTRNMSAIEAIGMGKKAATSIHNHLQGIPLTPYSSDLPAVARPLIDTTRYADHPPTAAPMLTKAERTGNFNEVEMAYAVDQAVTEAGRCLACGPCSECLACEKVCGTRAIVHDAAPSMIRIMVEAVIHGGNPEKIIAGTDPHLIRCKDPHAAFSGTAAAGRCLSLLETELPEPVSAPIPGTGSETPRTGVFICQCGGLISERLDTAALSTGAISNDHVVHTEVLPFSCTPSGIDQIGNAATRNRLNRIVLAACSCCALDQACLSCTLQRIRCKAALGLFTPGNSGHGVPSIPDALNLPPHAFEFVNIREHCAFAHEGSPEIATDKAARLIAAAVVRVRDVQDGAAVPDQIFPTVTLLGSGPAAVECRTILERQPLDLLHLTAMPDHIEPVPGGFRIQTDGTAHAARTLVLAPVSDRESARMRERIPGAAAQTIAPTSEKITDSPIQGIFICAPHGDPRENASAAAAMVTAWMGRRMRSIPQTAPRVDPHRCRACGTCREICEAGAPQMITRDGLRFSWIDPVRCVGCGTCAVKCPSDAIMAPHPSDKQLEAALDAVLCTERGMQ